MSYEFDDADYYHRGDSKGNEMLTFSYENVKAETGKAWLIDFGLLKEDDLDGTEHWLPKSKCRIDVGAKTIKIPAWLAEEKELETYAD